MWDPNPSQKIERLGKERLSGGSHFIQVIISFCLWPLPLFCTFAEGRRRNFGILDCLLLPLGLLLPSSNAPDNHTPITHPYPSSSPRFALGCIININNPISPSKTQNSTHIRHIPPQIQKYYCALSFNNELEGDGGLMIAFWRLSCVFFGQRKMIFSSAASHEVRSHTYQVLCVLHESILPCVSGFGWF